MCRVTRWKLLRSWRIICRFFPANSVSPQRQQGAWEEDAVGLESTELSVVFTGPGPLEFPGLISVSIPQLQHLCGTTGTGEGAGKNDGVRETGAKFILLGLCVKCGSVTNHGWTSIVPQL